MPFFLRIINDHSRLHQNTLLLHHTHGWERISGMWPINSSKNLHHIKSIVTGLLQRRVFIYNTHAHTHGHTQIALPPRPTSLGSDWLTRRVKRKRWKVIWVDSLNAIFMVCSDKVILTQAHTAIMHVHFFLTFYISMTGSQMSLEFEGDLQHMQVLLMGTKGGVCMSLVSAVTDLHQEETFIRSAGRWVRGEFRHRAAGFDAHGSVSALLGEQHSCGTCMQNVEWWLNV